MSGVDGWRHACLHHALLGGASTAALVVARELPRLHWLLNPPHTHTEPPLPPPTGGCCRRGRKRKGEEEEAEAAAAAAVVGEPTRVPCVSHQRGSLPVRAVLDTPCQPALPR